jgi:hypothetical protein
MLTCLPCIASAAAISEPMNPPQHPEAFLPSRKLLEPRIAVQGAEVDDLVAAKEQAPGRAAGGQEELLESVGLALIVHNLLLGQVQLPRHAAQVELDALRRRAPDLILGLLAGPQRLGERWAVVGFVRLGGDDPDLTWASTSRRPPAQPPTSCLPDDQYR